MKIFDVRKIEISVEDMQLLMRVLMRDIATHDTNERDFYDDCARTALHDMLKYAIETTTPDEINDFNA